MESGRDGDKGSGHPAGPFVAAISGRPDRKTTSPSMTVSRTRRLEHLLGRVDRNEVAVDDRQVGPHAGPEDAEPVLVERGEGRAGGEAAEGLVQGQQVLGVPAAVGLAAGVSAGQGGVEPPERG